MIDQTSHFTSDRNWSERRRQGRQRELFFTRLLIGNENFLVFNLKKFVIATNFGEIGDDLFDIRVEFPLIFEFLLLKENERMSKERKNDLLRSFRIVDRKSLWSFWRVHAPRSAGDEDEHFHWLEPCNAIAGIWIPVSRRSILRATFEAKRQRQRSSFSSPSIYFVLQQFHFAFARLMFTHQLVQFGQTIRR